MLRNELYGDEMEEFGWDVMSDSDEEIPELLELKSIVEQKDQIRLSKNGIKKFINDLLQYESASNTSNKKNAKLWESKVKQANMNLWIKKGGSPHSDSQPYVRFETMFAKPIKL